MRGCGNWQKYQSKNPLQRWLIGRFLDTVVEMTTPLSFSSVLDAGSGEGFVSQRLLDADSSVQITRLDLDADALKRGIKVHPGAMATIGSVTALPFGDDSFDLVLCNEVLEHLDQPESGLAELRRVSAHYVLISVPYEPVFSMMNLLRGKNIRRLGSDMDHCNLWTTRQFEGVASTCFKILDRRYPLPWQVLLAGIR